DLRLLRHAGVRRDLAEELERLRPEVHVAAGGALEVGRVLVGQDVLREGLRERVDALRAIVELPDVEVADVAERACALGVALALLAAVEEHLDELLVLAELAPQVLEADERDVVRRIEV